MLSIFIAAMAVVILIVAWIITVRRKLVLLDERIGNALSQIGVQMSSRFDAASVLLDLTRGYAEPEREALTDTLHGRRCLLTANATPEDVLRQENLIDEVMNGINAIIRRYPELKADRNMARATDAVKVYGNMIRTSCLVYNDCVTRLNREIRLFPVSLVAGLLGFEKKRYLEGSNR